MSGLTEVTSRQWDAVVVGAGPGGSLAARELARRGRSVLLVEKAKFPRWKVCGACLGQTGLRTLDRLGLGDLPAGLGARPVRHTRLVWCGRSIVIPMRGMVALSRGALDLALAEAARAAGAVFVDGVRAAWDEDGSVRVEGQPVDCRAVVLGAGLRAAEPDGHDGAWVADSSWIGLGVGAPAEDPHVFGEEGLTMVVGSRGYVGRVVTEDGLANWAAAVDPSFVRAQGSPAAAINAICDEAGLDVRVPSSGWVGTPSLTRRTPSQRGRVYRVGDAAGYVEPITGEGMSWALLGAAAAAPLIDRALARGWHGSAWQRRSGRLFVIRRARCGLVARGLRSPGAMRAAFGLLGRGGATPSAAVGMLIGGGPGRLSGRGDWP